MMQHKTMGVQINNTIKLPFVLSLPTCSLLGQIVQATVDYLLWRNQGSFLTFHLGDIPPHAWLLVSLSLLLVVVVNEVVKLHEIRYEAKKNTWDQSRIIEDYLESDEFDFLSSSSDQGCVVKLVFFQPVLIISCCLSSLSVTGCEFVTRRDRSCSLKQSWE